MKLSDSQRELVDAVRDLVHAHGEFVICLDSGVTHAEIRRLEEDQERAVRRLARVIFGNTPSIVECQMIDPDFRARS